MTHPTTSQPGTVTGTIFGREPALWVGLVETVLALLVAFHWWKLSAGQIGVITAVVSALLAAVVAVRTSDAVGAAMIQLLKALIALGVAFGLKLSGEQTAAIIAVASPVLSILLRSQVSPVDSAGNRIAAAAFPKTQAAGNAPR